MNESKLRWRRWLLVQILTLGRLPLSLAFAVLLVATERPEGHHGVAVIAAGILLLLANELSDLFDGMMARRYGIVSELGAMLDPYADSVSRLIVYWTLGTTGYLHPWVVLAMAVRDVSVAYSRILLTRSGLSVAAKLSGKIKAWVQAIAAFVAILGPFYWPWVGGAWPVTALSWLVAVATLASMVEYVNAALKATRAAGRDGPGR